MRAATSEPIDFPGKSDQIRGDSSGSDPFRAATRQRDLSMSLWMGLPDPEPFPIRSGLATLAFWRLNPPHGGRRQKSCDPDPGR